MIYSRMVRLFLLGLFWLPFSAGAVSRIDIHIGEIRHPAARVESLAATVRMDGSWHGSATLQQGDLSQFAKEQPLPVSISKGSFQGKVEFSGNDATLVSVKADLALRDAAFSDAEGLHAGDKVGGRITVDASPSGERWNWSGTLDWLEGEIFWQPVYVAKGGISLRGRGWLSNEAVAVDQAQVAMSGVGEAEVAGKWQRMDRRLDALEFTARNLDASAAYDVLLKPYLEKTLLGNLEMAGKADARLQMRDGRLQAFDIALHDYDVEDRGRRFALYKVDARVPWALNSPTQARLHYDGGQVLNMPLGTTDLAAVLNGYSLTAPVLKLPVLDGALTLTDISAAFLQGQWHWHLAASLSPLSMAEFSHAVGWPVMQGKVAASIPMVTYTGGNVTVDGAMGFDVFDGSVVVRNLALHNPLGLAPRLHADIQMRDLDLDLLTRTYSFGAMTGRLDGDVNNLELSNWKPVKFDADFRSSPGSYPKKISQRAVENISALGGAGAAAAIQRSFLRFFKEFNYAKIGLSCKLRNGVCQMDGVEPAQAGYVIVKGSGIPAITVLGYNRNVSWGELLERLQRITQGNKPVIK